MIARLPKILVLLFLPALLTATACSSVVHGIVRDKTTGHPISGAGVTIGDRNATTGATGVYEIRGISLSRLTTLLVNAPGYFLFNMSVAPSPGEGRELARDVELMAKAPGQGDQAIR